MGHVNVFVGMNGLDLGDDQDTVVPIPSWYSHCEYNSHGEWIATESYLSMFETDECVTGKVALERLEAFLATSGS